MRVLFSPASVPAPVMRSLLSPVLLNRATSNPSPHSPSRTVGREERSSHKFTHIHIPPLTINPRASLLLSPLGELASSEPDCLMHDDDSHHSMESQTPPSPSVRRAESQPVMGGGSDPWVKPVKDPVWPSEHPSLFFTPSPSLKLPESPASRLLTPSCLFTATVAMSAASIPLIPHSMSFPHCTTHSLPQ